MSEVSTVKIVINSIFWKVVERGGAQLLQFILTIILARLLSPKDYGTIALLIVFIAIANVFVESGLGTALIQKKKLTDTDVNTVFYTNILISILMIAILYILAPYVALFYKIPSLTLLLRVQSLTLFFSALSVVQNSLLSREMKFKNLFFISLSALIFSGIIGITTAYYGFGVWALIIQSLSYAALNSVALWIVIGWRPKFLFSFSSLTAMLNFGYKLLLSGLLNTIYENLYTIIIGKMFNKNLLGYYNQGRQIPYMVAINLSSTIQSVMFPAFSKFQDQPDRLKNMVRRSMMTSSFIIFPAMAGMIAIAEPMILTLLTEKWSPSIPFLQISCLGLALLPIHINNLEAINAVGRSDIFLKLEIIKKIITTLMLICTIPLGILAMLWGSVITGIIGTFINSYPNKRLLNYSYVEQIRDILPALLVSSIMGGVCYSLLWIGLLPLPTLLIQIFLGIAIFLGISYIFRLEALNYLLRVIKNYRTL